MAFSLLYVDDDPGSRMIVSTLLKSRGITLDTAEDGLQAVKMCKDHFYDIILMDYYMPNMNGVEAALEIKEFDTFNTPIYAITGNMHLINEDDVDVFDDICDKKDMLKFINDLIKSYQ